MADLSVRSGSTEETMRLSEAAVGCAGVIVDVRSGAAGEHGVSGEELQRRLLEFGFVEGARFEVIHEGLIRRDPMAVRVDETRVALRRQDAAEVLVRVEGRRK